MTSAVKFKVCIGTRFIHSTKQAHNKSKIVFLNSANRKHGNLLSASIRVWHEASFYSNVRSFLGGKI